MLEDSAPWLAPGYKNRLGRTADLVLQADSTDSFILCSEDDARSLASVSITEPEEFHIAAYRKTSKSKNPSRSRPSSVQLRVHRRYGEESDRVTTPARPCSAQAAFGRSRPSTAGFSRPQSGKLRRPASARAPSVIAKTGSSRPPSAPVRAWVCDENGPNDSRPSSSTHGRNSSKKGVFTVVNKLYEEDTMRQKMTFHPHPDHRYFSRHSKCFDHTHMHTELLPSRPQTACDNLHHREDEAGSPVHRPKSAPSSERLAVKIRRFIDCHRPRITVGERKELQHLPRNNYILRGNNPYFTNFVYKVPIHKRADDDEDEANRGGADTDVLDGTGHKRRVSYSGCSGAEGRPASPNSSLNQSEITDDETNFSVQFSNLIDVKIRTKQQTSSRPTSGFQLRHYNGPGDSVPSPKPQAWKPFSKSPSIDSLLTDGQKTSQSQSTNNGKPVRRKRCIVKKSRKPIERPKPSGQTEESNLPVKVGEEETKTEITPDLPDSDPASLPKVEAVVPELPQSTPKDKAKKGNKHQNRSRRSLIFNTNEPYIQPDLLEKMETDIRLKKTTDIHISSDSDDSLKFTSRPQQMVQGRLALSQQSSRFELPMDMKMLEILSPQDYVRTYCIVSSRRQLIYQKIFFKNKDKTGTIPLKDLERALRDVLVGTLTKQNVEQVCKWLEIDESSKIDFKLFAGMAALAERVLYPRFVTGDTLDIPEFQKEKIECADFGALSWKLKGVNINPAIKHLLKMIS